MTATRHRQATNTERPPRLARWLLTRILDGPVRSAIVGDLDEEFTTFVVQQRGLRAARRWYWRQTLTSIVACLRAPSPVPVVDGELRSIRRAITHDPHG